MEKGRGSGGELRTQKPGCPNEQAHGNACQLHPCSIDREGCNEIRQTAQVGGLGKQTEQRQGGRVREIGKERSGWIGEKRRDGWMDRWRKR